MTAEIKLHLGCGKRYLKGYVHIDLANYKHVNYIWDIRKLSGLEDSTVDLIYASHVIAYFDRNEIVDIFKEWRRVLKIGGTLRIATPDFIALVRVYTRYQDIDLIHGSIYGKWEIHNNFETIYHKTIYDFFSLQKVFSQAGFKHVKRWGWKDIFIDEHKGFDDYSQSYIPHMDKENGILISLNMEATK